MQPLNFPKFDFRFKSTENQLRIFDIIRKKFVLLGPEEWVRQHVIHFLVFIKKYPKSHINVEKQIVVKGRPKRYDVVVFDTLGNIQLLVECKAPYVALHQSTFDQIAIYNLQTAANFLMVTNGLHHLFCQMDMKQEKYVFLPDIPEFSR